MEELISDSEIIDAIGRCETRECVEELFLKNNISDLGKRSSLVRRTFRVSGAEIESEEDLDKLLGITFQIKEEATASDFEALPQTINN